MAPCLASSRPYATARPLLATVRVHLGIGNGLHWILSVVFWEDESHVHTRPSTYACCEPGSLHHRLAPPKACPFPTIAAGDVLIAPASGLASSDGMQQ